MIYKKKILLDFKPESRYDILKEDSELPIFVDKKWGRYFQTETKKEFYDCLMSTKPDYFETPSFIKEICDIFSYLNPIQKATKNYLIRPVRQL